MPPRAYEHTMLLDSKSSVNDDDIPEGGGGAQRKQESSGFPQNDMNRNNSSHHTNNNCCRIIIKWTAIAIVLFSGVIVVGIISKYHKTIVEPPSMSRSASATTRTVGTQQQQPQSTQPLTTAGSSAEKSTSDDRFTNSKYKKVQGIGFQIYTGGAPALLKNHHSKNNDVNATDALLNPECIGRDSYGQVVGEDAPMLQCYIGLSDPLLDVRGRIEIMTDAVEMAYAHADNEDSETLKIFIAPEFYFRGITGAYSFENDELPNDPSVCGPICQILVGLEAIVAQERFEHWIFLFGTIVASDVLPTDDPYDYLFYNFAPVYKGYNPDTTGIAGKRFLVPKRYVSSSDFLTPQRHLNESSFKQLMGQQQKIVRPGDATVYNPHDFNQRRYDPSMWTKYKDELGQLGYTMIEYDWLMVDGLSLTFEVCFDHQMRTALNTYLGDMVTGRRTMIPSSTDNGVSYVHIPPYQAQISIVSSAGMTVTPDSLALTHGGTIFLQDGLSNVSNGMIWSVDGCEQGLQFEGGTEAAQRRSFLSPTDVIFDHKALSHFERHDLYQHWHSALKGAFSAQVYPPQLIVFRSVDIAEVVL